MGKKESMDFSPFLGLFKTLFLIALPFGLAYGILSFVGEKEFSPIGKVIAALTPTNLITMPK